VHQVLICNPPGKALLNEGNKSDEIDARMLADFVAHGHAMNNKGSRQLLKTGVYTQNLRFGVNE
jgi:hypothetical protein